jgi:hypothetical protein
MTLDDSKDQQLSRAATIVRQQITRIAELEAEVDRLMAVIANIPDALTRLQRLYTDPKSSPSLVAKAAGLAIGFERPKIDANVSLDANILFDRLEARRLEKRKARHWQHPAVFQDGWRVRAEGARGDHRPHSASGLLGLLVHSLGSTHIA